jgi:hypothetical protein
MIDTMQPTWFPNVARDDKSVCAIAPAALVTPCCFVLSDVLVNQLGIIELSGG